MRGRPRVFKGARAALQERNLLRGVGEDLGQKVRLDVAAA
jgi:hypothetical protein